MLRKARHLNADLRLQRLFSSKRSICPITLTHPKVIRKQSLNTVLDNAAIKQEQKPISNTVSNTVDSFTLKQEIDAMFAEVTVSPKVVDKFVWNKLQGCTASDISNFMRLLGKKKNTPNLILKRHLLAIATQLARMTSARWDYASVSFVLYGLQSVREGDA